MLLTTLRNDPSGQLLLLLVSVFAVFAALIIPSYFLAMRPARGTTEWMQRIDRPKFAPLLSHKLRWGDIAWALLSGFCAAMLRLISYLLTYLSRNWLEILPRVFKSLALYRLLPCAVLGIALYLLLRSLFELTVPSVCGALLGGLMQIDNAWAAALVALSFFFLWRWMAADANAPIFPRALLLLMSLACYGLGLMRYWALVWLAPLYVAAYLYAQIYRWRKTTLPNRGISLAISGLLLFFTGIGALLCAWVYYCYSTGRVEQILNLQQFFAVMPKKIVYRMNFLIAPLNLRGSVYAADAILFLIGLFSYVPIIHGAFSRRDSRCVVLLAMPLPFAAVWLCGGMYLAAPVLICALAWVCNTLSERDHPGLAAGFTVVTASSFLLEHFI